MAAFATAGWRTSGGSTPVQDERAQRHPPLLQRLGQEPRLADRCSLQRADDHERGAIIGEQSLDLLRPGDEACLHRLEEDEEFGDVLQEPRTQHPIGDLVEGLGSDGEQARPVRHGEPTQQTAAEELLHV
ncbi:MAG: hypothetical protein WCK21_05760, partial [Actinomycetota bacterium]